MKELDRATTTLDMLQSGKCLNDRDFIAEPVSNVEGMQNLRFLTPEFRSDMISSRIRMPTGNEFGGQSGARVNLRY